MRMKKLLSLVAAAALTFSMAACGSTNNGSDTTQAVEGAIDVVSREAGSGTRSAFEEIIGFNGEPITYVFSYVIKFLIHPKLYLFKKY